MKRRITQSDYIKANRKASREEEIAAHGKPLLRTRVHRSEKIYNRKRAKAGLRKGLPDFFTQRLHSQTILRTN